MSELDFKNALQFLVEHGKRQFFVDGYEATDTEVLGLIVSRYAEWDGLAIMDVAVHALEDSNFHTESAVINDMKAKLQNV